MTGIPTISNCDTADPILSFPDDEALKMARHDAWKAWAYPAFNDRTPTVKTYEWIAFFEPD